MRASRSVELDNAVIDRKKRRALPKMPVIGFFQRAEQWPAEIITEAGGV